MGVEVTLPVLEEGREVSSAQLAAAIGEADFTGCAATVVGYGNMGKQYVQALRALGVKRIRVCSRSAGPLQELGNTPGVETVEGGFERLDCARHPEELGIIAAPIGASAAAAQRLAELGFRRLLIEKPVSLCSREIQELADSLDRQGVEAWCAYNRVAYPSFHELRALTDRDGGITSCTYTFTEMIRPDWTQRFPPEVLARWGIANSLHVMSMAHGLIGWPTEWSGHRSGALPWHPAGAVFVGSGVSQRGIPFGYHADWGSTGRWSVEVHTHQASYRLCPLEKVFRKPSVAEDWEEVPAAAFAPSVKAGIAEQVAGALNHDLQQIVPLISVADAALLTKYGEGVFGYGDP